MKYIPIVLAKRVKPLKNVSYIFKIFKGKTDFKEKNELQKFIKEEVVDNSILIGKFKLF